MDRLISETYDNIYLIEKGVRSCCTTSFGWGEDYMKRWNVPSPKEAAQILIDIAKDHNLYGVAYKFYTYDDNGNKETGEDNYTVYIYKYSHQINIITAIEKLHDHSFMYEWMLGKLLGYCDGAMEEFLVDNTYSRYKINTDIEYTVIDR